jgi:hypothetical protein
VSAPAFSIARLSPNGFIFRRRFFPELPSHEAFNRLGKIEKLEGMDQIQTLRPKPKDQSTSNTYSGTFGDQHFPLHTDLAHWAIPPRFDSDA